MRGFVTIATGNIFYYKMARNLLRSYRLHNKNYRFAILCDRENEYTAEFDDVIILEDVSFSYRDKFRLLTDCPYDENIFIETDCLIYRNLDCFWNLLSKEYDLTTFGWNDGDTRVWFKDAFLLEDMGLEDTNIPIFNPGYLFIRNGKLCDKAYQDIQKIEKLIRKKYTYYDKCFVGDALRDDPLWCLVFKINGCKCTVKPSIGKCMAVPSGYKILKANLQKGLLTVVDKKGQQFENCSLLHFSTRRAREEGLYMQQASVLNALLGKYKCLAKLLNTKVIGCVFFVYKKIKTKVRYFKCK